MEIDSALFSSVICKRCNSSLIRSYTENNLTKYSCMCCQKIRIVLTCNFCAKKFLNLPYLIRKTNYCSLNCYWVGTNRKKLRNCKRCGKSFNVDNSLIKKGYGFYCSRDCWFVLFQKKRKFKKCSHCNKNFKIAPSVDRNRSGAKFCSKKCADDFKRDYVKSTCQGCKKQFELPRSPFNRGRGSFCTRECFKRYDGETSIERKVRLELEKLDEVFIQEAKFGRFYADFFLSERKIIIECDGEYWHRGKVKKDRDKRKDKLLKELGYKVIRLEEEQIKSNNLNLSNFLNT